MSSAGDAGGEVHLITAINLGLYINLGSEINWTRLLLVLTWRKQSYDKSPLEFKKGENACRRLDMVFGRRSSSFLSCRQ
ncbi:unnamed protein product [Chondrus crispus]|uniref:Uncharacterized protein n=1 Tax=Chondrus crispus TaxID=2769 RepID=R7Q0L0_CHOCR|nr:unnamed protein product [Chondrus crispus]CDF32187.1 unnamed protein product [Chondrus crispus]|eukprot:XP_005711852.1 unnamed protein product [Chondrus crispus]